MSTIEFVLGFCAPAVIYGLVLILHLLLPASEVEGYVTNPDTNLPYSYRLNGLTILVVTTAIWAAIGWLGWLPWDWFYQHRWSSLTGACALGLAYTAILVFNAPSGGKPLIAELFLGRVENMQYAGRVDAKMYLYMAGAIMLMLNALAAGAHHHVLFGSAANPGVWLYLLLLSFFLLDYLWFERVHLYTYDLFAERLGFKLAWGCLVFYPFFYPIGLWGTAHLGTPSTIEKAQWFWLVGSAGVFFLGWSLARGANMQKYLFKRFPDRPFLGRLAPEAITDGKQQVLSNGFWGVARHINYLGEILMATGLALSLGHIASPWPWLYPLYYIALLVPRQRDDDRRCAAKYGALWDEYRAKVPYRIIPRVY
ncbi:MAG: DUF1295 domain-containing protein [Pseudomonadales bacterium]